MSDWEELRGNIMNLSHLSEKTNEPNSMTFLYNTNFKAQCPNSKKEREVQMNVWILFMCVWTSLGLFCVTDYAFYKQSQHMLYINYYKHVWLRARNEPHIFCYNYITQFSSCSKWTSYSSGIIWNKNKWWETNCQTQFWGISYQAWLINK